MLNLPVILLIFFSKICTDGSWTNWQVPIYSFQYGTASVANPVPHGSTFNLVPGSRCSLKCGSRSGPSNWKIYLLKTKIYYDRRSFIKYIQKVNFVFNKTSLIEVKYIIFLPTWNVLMLGKISSFLVRLLNFSQHFFIVRKILVDFSSLLVWNLVLFNEIMLS
jgi:hypothetical protein